MSKASEFAKAMKDRPKFDHGSLHAKATDGGDLEISSTITLGPDSAVVFARWILETFKEKES